MLKFTALESALIDQPKAPKRQGGALDGALDDALAAKILDVLRDNPNITQVELAVQLNSSRRTIQRTLDDLKKAGIIERIGGKRYGGWQINSIPDSVS